MNCVIEDWLVCIVGLWR